MLCKDSTIPLYVMYSETLQYGYMFVCVEVLRQVNPLNGVMSKAVQLTLQHFYWAGLALFF